MEINKIKCPICGKIMRFNAEFDAEIPSEEQRIITQYICECGTEITLSYTND